MAEWIVEKTNYVPDKQSIPIERAGICWQRRHANKVEYGSAVTDVAVVDLDIANTDGTDEAGLWDDSWKTGGACMVDWQRGNNPRQSPLGFFAAMAYDGTMPKGRDFALLLHQFAKIEGCEWALHMLAALHMGDFIGPDGEEWSFGS